MVITHVIGGLGNQMFQYACGLSLSKRLSVELLIDVSDFSHYSLHHGFELHKVFSAEFKLATQQDVQQVLGGYARGWRRKLMQRKILAPHLPRRIALENEISYSTDLLNRSSPVYLQGYWQSECYFSDISADIRKAFTFKPTAEPRNVVCAEKIQSMTAVALHVRRGDYVQNKTTQQIHGACSLAYYQAAIKRMQTLVSDITFFVFSDDIAWCKSYLQFSSPHEFIDWNTGAASYHDMLLMSLCKHHIISNSSFSWWGAWLGDQLGHVIAPQPWFRQVSAADKSIVPKRWIVLDK